MSKVTTKIGHMLVYLAILVIGGGFLVPQIQAVSTEYRRCELNSTCTIGEFLYDDNYAPITAGATCKLTSRNSAGTIVLNSINLLTTGTDGWYAHDLPTATLSAGLYRSTICCTASGETLCLDKSFIVGASFTSKEDVADAVWDEARSGHNTAGSFGENLQNPSSVSAADIWSYPTRSLTSFGTLVADIWSYTTRTVSGVGSTAADIWAYATRTLTGASLSSGSIATQGDVTAVSDKVSSAATNVTNLTTTNTTNNTTINTQLQTISEQLQEEHDSLEQLVSKPVIKNFVEENQETTPLESKLQKTRSVVNRVYADTQNLKISLETLTASWDQQTTGTKRSGLTAFSSVLGMSTEDPDPESLTGQIDWLVSAWNDAVIGRILTEREKVLAVTKLASLKLNTSGQSADLKPELEVGYNALTELEKIVGSSSDLQEQGTLFGLVRQLEQIAASLDQYDQELDKVIAQLAAYTGPSLSAVLDDLTERVLKINQVPDALVILDRAQDKAHPENRAFTLKALIETNKTILSHMANEPASHVWLENGSVVFKSLVTNPSSTIRQSIPIHYVLPKEVSREDIVSIDKGLTVAYDPIEDAVVATGEIELGPQQSKVLIVEVQDVWKISAEQIAALRKQNDTLFQPLKNTAYFAQGATLKADIEVALDRVEAIQAEAKTPDARIKAYREAQLELNGAKSKLEDMKTLVASAGSVGTVFGFVGGVQTLEVWGLILILVTGFIFLAISMRALTRGKPMIVKQPTPVPAPKGKSKAPTVAAPAVGVAAAKVVSEGSSFVIHLPKRNFWIFGVGVLIFVIIILIIWVWSLTRQVQLISPVPSSAPQTTPVPTPSPTPTLEATPGAKLTGRLEPPMVLGTQSEPQVDEVLIVVPENVVAVNIRSKPAAGSDIVKDVVQDTPAKKTGEKNGWVGVEFTTKKGRLIIGWVDGKYIQAPGEVTP